MLQTLAQNWWAIALRGLCSVLFGVSAFAWPGITLTVLVLFHGPYALADGLLAVAWAVMGRPWRVSPGGGSWLGWRASPSGSSPPLAGTHPLVLVYLIAAWALLRGVFEIIAAVQLRHELETSGSRPERRSFHGPRVLAVRRPGRRSPGGAVVDRRLRHPVRRLDDDPRLPVEGAAGPGRPSDSVDSKRLTPTSEDSPPFHSAAPTILPTA